MSEASRARASGRSSFLASCGARAHWAMLINDLLFITFDESELKNNDLLYFTIHKTGISFNEKRDKNYRRKIAYWFKEFFNHKGRSIFLFATILFLWLFTIFLMRARILIACNNSFVSQLTLMF